jgi:outer membrane protein TolC
MQVMHGLPIHTEASPLSCRKIRFLSLLRAVAFLFGVLLAFEIHAQTVAPPTNATVLHLTLAQAIDEALKTNPGLKAAGHQNRAAVNDASAAARSRWGEVDVTGTYGYFNDDQILRPMSRELVSGGLAGMPFDRSQLHYGFTYQVPLYLGGKLKNQIQIARLESQKAVALLAGTRWQVRFNAVSLYSAAQTLDQVLSALDQQIAALGQTKTNLDEMVRIGRRPEVDRLKVLDELEAARSQRAAVESDRVKVGALLLAMLGRDPAGRVAVDPLPGAIPKLDVPEAALTAGIENNSAVRSAHLAAEQAERNVRVARSDYLPKLYAGASYIEHTGTEIDRTLETWGASVSVVFPLFEGNVRGKRVAAAMERQAAAQEMLGQAKLKVQAELQEALAKLDAARVALEAARVRVVAAAEAARIEQARYDTGAGTIEDLLRARAREQGARAALATARGDLIIAAERINAVVEEEVVK